MRKWSIDGGAERQSGCPAGGLDAPARMVFSRLPLHQHRFAIIAHVSIRTLNKASLTRKTKMPIHKVPYGQLDNGQDVFSYHLANAQGMEAQILDYGGTVVRLTAPDRTGRWEDVVLGFDSLSQYQRQESYFGVLIGRFANRIQESRFTLDGVTYQLTRNHGAHQLHGGLSGFDKKVWQAEMDQDSLRLTYISADGEEGYPGELRATVTYSLSDDNALHIVYDAVTTKPTAVSLTNHSYFNLAGHGVGTILDHVLRIDADAFTPVDETLIPTGEIRPVEGTVMDFRQPRVIGESIHADDEQLKRGFGYDHNWVLNAFPGEPALAITLTHPASGRRMDVLTDTPGVQFYSGNHIDQNGAQPGKDGRSYAKWAGLCLETQHFPDAVNQPGFPSSFLRPGDHYRQHTIYRFSAE